MMVICSGYCARSRSGMRTPSARGVEGDVEMMLARQRALLGGVGEHAAHDAAQRLLGQEIVADLVGHGGYQYFRIRVMLARRAAESMPC